MGYHERTNRAKRIKRENHERDMRRGLRRNMGREKYKEKTQAMSPFHFGNRQHMLSTGRVGHLPRLRQQVWTPNIDDRAWPVDFSVQILDCQRPVIVE